MSGYNYSDAYVIPDLADLNTAATNGGLVPLEYAY